MKRCVDCSHLVEDGVTECPECGGEQFRAVVTEGDGQAEAAAPEPAAPPADPGEPVQPPPEAEAVDEPVPPPAGAAFDFAGGQPASDEAEIINDPAQLGALKAEKLFVIGLLGFPTGGKTWFLNRLKRSYHQPSVGSRQYRRPATVPSPPAASESERVSRTNEISRHRFDTPTHPHLSFNLLDIPGERFARAAERKFVGVNQLVLACLQTCDAVIVVLPADEVLFAPKVANRERCAIWRAVVAGKVDPASARLGLPPQDQRTAADLEGELIVAQGHLQRARGAARTRLKTEISRLESEIEERREWRLAEAANQVEDFANSIGLLAAIMNLQDHGMAPAQIEALPNAPAIMAKSAELGHKPRRQPMFVALSKMDAVIAPNDSLARKLDTIKVTEDVRQRLDVDPLATLEERSSGIAFHTRNAFEWCKVDAVTAFGGHEGGDIIEYDRCDVYGVDSLIEWIHWARSMGGARPWQRWAARAARAVRKARDLAS